VWINRLVMVTLLVLLLWAMYITGRMLGIEAQSMAVGMLYGALAGMPATLLVLVTARRSAPAPVVVEDEPWRHEDEDDAPYETFPEPLTVEQMLRDEEELMDVPELPSVMLWRMRETQADARRRGWECADVDAWLERNAAKIEADCKARFEAAR